jgi:hypothetical protein
VPNVERYEVVIDPPGVSPPGRTPIYLNRPPFAIGGEGRGINWGTAEAKQYEAETRYGQVPADWRLPNRVIEIPLLLGAGRETSEQEEEEARRMLSERVGLLQREGGVLLRQRQGKVVNLVPTPTFTYGTGSWGRWSINVSAGRATLTAFEGWHGARTASTSLLVQSYLESLARSGEPGELGCVSPAFSVSGASFLSVRARVYLHPASSGTLVFRALFYNALGVELPLEAAHMLVSPGNEAEVVFAGPTAIAVPAQAATCRLFFAAAFTGGGESASFFLDEIQALTGTVLPPYADGDSPVASWEGTPGASATRSSTPLYADIVDAALTAPDVYGEGGGVEPGVVLRLTCRPDFYGAPRTLVRDRRVRAIGAVPLALKGLCAAGSAVWGTTAHSVVRLDSLGAYEQTVTTSTLAGPVAGYAAIEIYAVANNSSGAPRVVVPFNPHVGTPLPEAPANIVSLAAAPGHLFAVVSEAPYLAQFIFSENKWTPHPVQPPAQPTWVAYRACGPTIEGRPTGQLFVGTASAIYMLDAGARAWVQVAAYKAVQVAAGPPGIAYLEAVPGTPQLALAGNGSPTEALASFPTSVEGIAINDEGRLFAAAEEVGGTTTIYAVEPDIYARIASGFSARTFLTPVPVGGDVPQRGELTVVPQSFNLLYGLRRPAQPGIKNAAIIPATALNRMGSAGAGVLFGSPGCALVFTPPTAPPFAPMCELVVFGASGESLPFTHGGSFAVWALVEPNGATLRLSWWRGRHPPGGATALPPVAPGTTSGPQWVRLGVIRNPGGLAWSGRIEAYGPHEVSLNALAIQPLDNSAGVLSVPQLAPVGAVEAAPVYGVWNERSLGGGPEWTAGTERSWTVSVTAAGETGYLAVAYRVAAPYPTNFLRLVLCYVGFSRSSKVTPKLLWRINGGAWKATQAVVSELSPSRYVLEFEALSVSEEEGDAILEVAFAFTTTEAGTLTVTPVGLVEVRSASQLPFASSLTLSASGAFTRGEATAAPTPTPGPEGDLLRLQPSGATAEVLVIGLREGTVLPGGAPSYAPGGLPEVSSLVVYPSYATRP